METDTPPSIEEPATSPASVPATGHGYPPPYVVEPTAPHTHTAILLHGLGSNGREFGSFFLTASITSTAKDHPCSRALDVLYPSMRLVFPSASRRRSAGFNRVKLFSWFDIFSVQDPGIREEIQAEGLRESGQYLRDLIDAEREVLKNGYDRVEGTEKKIVLGGLSQGCAISLATLLSLDYSLGGWAGMSGFLPMRGMVKDVLNAAFETNDGGIFFDDDHVERHIPPAEGLSTIDGASASTAVNAIRQDVLSIPHLNSGKPPNVLATPAFYGHGSADQKVPCELGNELVEVLKQLDVNVRHRVYEGLDHWIQVPEEINDMISVFTQHGSWPHHVGASAP